MGIKDLWTILSPLCERKPLYELEGKTIAIDLSCWICEAQNIAEYHIQPRMYLRNLYFRACCLLLIGVNPVFVLEGKAPTLKYDTIAIRNAIQFKGAKPRKNDTIKGGKDRSRFKFTLQQCEKMLQYMGLACVQGNGEAEAMCAYLNEDNFVDGCISQDSDCFAYGAKIVYRNFSISQQGSQSSTGGSVDVYDINRSIETLGIGRNKIIVLALLCGSDYSPGVRGVGKDSALKFFENVSDDRVLNRVREWVNDAGTFEEMQSRIMDKNICTSCGHHGKVQVHAKKGCLRCSMSVGCKSHYKEQYAYVKNELAIRSKAMADPTFPNEELIKEFLIKKDNISQANVQWKRPDMINFVKFTAQYMQWEEIYAFQKLLPILTRWQILNHQQIDDNTRGILYPQLIKKRRNPKGVSSYEIIWEDTKEYFNNLIPDEQLNSVDKLKLYSTIEPEHLVNKVYPELVENFELSKVKIKKSTKRKKNSNNNNKVNVDDIDEMLKNTSISMEIVKKKPRTIKNKLKSKNNIDNHFKKAITNRNNSNPINISFSTPNKKGVTFDFNMSNLDFDCDDCKDLSNIVDDIVKRPTDLITNQITEIRKMLINDDINGMLEEKENDDIDFMACKDITDDLRQFKDNNIRDVKEDDLNQLKDDDFKMLRKDEVERFEDDEKNTFGNENCNKSNFFVKCLKVNDSFEKSFNKLTAVRSESDEEDDDKTEEYELNMSFLDRYRKKSEIEDEYKVNNLLGDDSFEICTVPLHERIKARK